MVTTKLYVEGGGDGNLDTFCRQGFSRLLESAGLKDRMPRITACGGRDQAFRNFKTAMKNRQPGELPLLLVDSEDVVDAGLSVWQHLNDRDGWDKPEGTGNDQAFLMAVCMETWFIADREALENFFGNQFKEGLIPKWPDLEVVPKGNIFAVLKSATAKCEKKKYSKGKVSFELLGTIDAATVTANCTHAAEFSSAFVTYEFSTESGPVSSVE